MERKESIRRTVICLLGVIVVALGGLVIVGWIFRTPSLIQLRPSWPSMTLYTALSLCIAGFSLLLPRIAYGPWRTRSYILFGLILCGYGGLVLVETLFEFDLGIEPHTLHRLFDTASQWPGRMDVTTALCATLLGASFALLTYLNGTRYIFILQTLIAIELIISGTGLLGYALKALLAFSWVNLTTMAIHTAIGMFLAGIGLLLTITSLHSAYSAPIERVIITSTILLITVGTLVGITGLILSQQEKERSFSRELSLKGIELRRRIDTSIDNRRQRGQVVSYLLGADPTILKLVHAQEGVAIPDSLKHLAEGLASNVFTAIAYENLQGKIFPLVGVMLDKLEADIPIHDADNNNELAHLIWNNNYVLRLRLPVTTSGELIGHIISDQPIVVLTMITQELQLSEDTGGILICTQTPTELRCFPDHRHTHPFNLPTDKTGPPTLPIALAIAGQAGQIYTLDYLGQPILADYAPVGNTGLGLVAKVDARSLRAKPKSIFSWLTPDCSAYCPRRLDFIAPDTPCVASAQRVRGFNKKARATAFIHESGTGAQS